MNREEVKIMADSLIEASKLGTINALGYIQNGLEAYKKIQIPIMSADGEVCYGNRMPYRDDKGVQTFVDFMLVYIDEAIKSLDKKNEE